MGRERAPARVVDGAWLQRWKSEVERGELPVRGGVEGVVEGCEEGIVDRVEARPS